MMLVMQAAWRLQRRNLRRRGDHRDSTMRKSRHCINNVTEIVARKHQTTSYSGVSELDLLGPRLRPRQTGGCFGLTRHGQISITDVRTRHLASVLLQSCRPGCVRIVQNAVRRLSDALAVTVRQRARDRRSRHPTRTLLTLSTRYSTCVSYRESDGEAI